jgi:DNA-binding MarR family transcriptional regulator
MNLTVARRTSTVGDRQTAEDIIAAFRSGMRELRCIATDRMRRRGVSMTQQHILWMLDRHGELPMSRLAEMLDVSLSNATGLIDRLEERGVVERVRVAEDRRIVLVRISERGRQALAEIEMLREDLLQRIIAELDQEQLDRLAISLDDLRGAIGTVLAKDPTAFAAEHTHAR